MRRFFANSPFKNLGIVYGNALINEKGNFESYYFAVNAEKKNNKSNWRYLLSIRG
jgi:hypothetical protein